MRLRQINPNSVLANFCYRNGRNPVCFCHVVVGYITFVLAYFRYLILCEFSPAVGLPFEMCAASFFRPVDIVLSFCAKKNVFRVAAGGIVTFMKGTHSFWNIDSRQDKRERMAANVSAAKPYLTIPPLVSHGAIPRPTLAGTFNINTAPKPWDNIIRHVCPTEGFAFHSRSIHQINSECNHEYASS
jgi:hypothetical protein